MATTREDALPGRSCVLQSMTSRPDGRRTIRRRPACRRLVSSR
jgi:hypothetical protein